jgi:hypothetical protein
VLGTVLAETPINDEVVSSQGFVGRFAGREWAYPWWKLPTKSFDRIIPVHSHSIVFLVSTYQGVEVSSVEQEAARVQSLSHLAHTTLILHKNGIWAFRWHDSGPLPKMLLISETPVDNPAWALGNAIGRPVLNGPVSDWHVASDGSQGYLLDRAYLRPTEFGQVMATVKYSSLDTFNLEIWNSTGGVLLARKSVPSSNGQVVTTRITARYVRRYPNRLYTGWGPFVVTPAGLNESNQLELRAWTPAGSTVNIYTVSFYQS